MASKISVVINTLNEEANIERVIKSAKFADEIIVCDMHSDDDTTKIAKSLGAKIFLHKRVGYVEPARNFAIGKATNDWILILDADEEIPNTLSTRLKELAEKKISANFIEIPRKNIIFGKWMKASFWWPDYQIRFFKKGSVIWSDNIHSKPETKGEGLKLSEEEDFAILHHNYRSVFQFIERLNRYTEIEAKQLLSEGYAFSWKDLIQKPTNEFLSRFFANKGYLDGLHGLSLSLLQAFSFLIVYLKVWEKNRFKEEGISLDDIVGEREKSTNALNYWMKKPDSGGNFFKKFFKV